MNYDLPWNPQRFRAAPGRIQAGIGSPHFRRALQLLFARRSASVELFGLEEKIGRETLALPTPAVGVGQVLPGQVTDPNVEVALADIDEVHDQIRVCTARGSATLLENDGEPAAACRRGGATVRLAKAMVDPLVQGDVHGGLTNTGAGVGTGYPYGFVGPPRYLVPDTQTIRKP